jgi:biopolymer transport protein ExbD
MATIRGKEKKETPGISTASLPDIIFILLFFFMVATVMREREVKVQVIVPDGTEIVKLRKKSLISHIYIGKPTDVALGDASRIQLNDVIGNHKKVGEFVEIERKKLPEIDRKKMIVSMKVDTETKMGIVFDVKQELRKANALKINYAAAPRAELE